MSRELEATGIVVSGLPSGCGPIVDVQIPGFTMNDIDTTDQDTSGYRTSRPARLATPGELGLTHKWSGQMPTPQTSGNNAYTVYIPDATASGGVSGVHSGFIAVIFSGYLKSYQPQKAGQGALIMADSVVKVNGAIVIE